MKQITIDINDSDLELLEGMAREAGVPTAGWASYLMSLNCAMTRKFIKGTSLEKAVIDWPKGEGGR